MSSHQRASPRFASQPAALRTTADYLRTFSHTRFLTYETSAILLLTNLLTDAMHARVAGDKLLPSPHSFWRGCSCWQVSAISREDLFALFASMRQGTDRHGHIAHIPRYPRAINRLRWHAIRLAVVRSIRARVRAQDLAPGSLVVKGPPGGPNPPAALAAAKGVWELSFQSMTMDAVTAGPAAALGAAARASQPAAADAKLLKRPSKVIDGGKQASVAVGGPLDKKSDWSLWA